MKLPEYDRSYDPRTFSSNDQTKIKGYRANLVIAKRLGDKVWEGESLYSLGCMLQVNRPDVVEAITDFEQAIEIFHQEHEVRLFYEASLNLGAVYENRVQDKQAALKVYERAAQQGEKTVEGTIEDDHRKSALHYIERIKREIQQDKTHN